MARCGRVKLWIIVFLGVGLLGEGGSGVSCTLGLPMFGRSYCGVFFLIISLNLSESCQSNLNLTSGRSRHRNFP